MKTTLLLGLMMICPSMALAEMECQVVELPDHFEAICSGDTPVTPESLKMTTSNTALPQEARLRGRVMQEQEQEQAVMQEKTAAQEQTAVTGQQSYAFAVTHNAVPQQTTFAQQQTGAASAPPATTRVAEQSAVSVQASLQEQPETAPTSALIITRRGRFWVNSSSSGEYTITPTYTPQG
jgi:hypothetical protein